MWNITLFLFYTQVFTPKIDNIYMVGSESLQMVLEVIPDPDVGLYLFNLARGVSVWPHNPIRYNKNFVSK